MTLTSLTNLPTDILSRMVAERMGFNIVDVPFVPSKVRGECYFTAEAYRQMCVTYPGGGGWKMIPRFASSLDHMATAEATLTDEQKLARTVRLYHLVIPESEQFPDHFLSWDIASKLLDATARQRAIAFLSLEP